MGVFDGIGGAQYFEGGKYVAPGLYKAQIQKVKYAKTRNGRPFFVVEMKVLESSNLTDHPLGTDFSWMAMMDQDAALGNVKHFLSVASDTPINEIQASDAEDAVGEDNPLAGTEIRVMAVNIKTKAGKDFTKCKFLSASMSAADAAAAHAKDAEASAPAAAAPPAA